MACVRCPDCEGQVSARARACVHCGYCQPAPRRRWRGALAEKAAGYLLEAATLLPLFRMTMPRDARPTWLGSWGIFAALVLAAAALLAGARRATREVPAARWRPGPA
jgi:hypothetical protein